MFLPYFLLIYHSIVQFLSHPKSPLCSDFELSYNSIELQKITLYINEQENFLNAPTTRLTITANFTLSQHDKCRNCTECANINLEVRTSLRNPTEILSTIAPLVHAFKDPYYENKLSQYGNL